MNTAYAVEKMNSDKQRKGYGEEVIKKGDKRNKVIRNRDAKRNWE